MTTVNLIPKHRRLARQRRTHVRRAAGVCVAWAVLTVLGGTGTYFLWPESRIVSERLARAERDLAALTSVSNAARAELTTVEATYRATRAIANQPDWSLLMALIANAVGPEIVLQGFVVSPPEPEAPLKAGATPPPAPVAPTQRGGARPTIAPLPPQPVLRQNVTIRGIGRTQLAVTQFVLRLERTSLFSRVTLLDTSRETFADQPAVAFQIECVLVRDPGGAGNGRPELMPKPAGTGVAVTQ